MINYIVLVLKNKPNLGQIWAREIQVHMTQDPSVQEMKRHLSMYVKNDMFGGINLPPKTNKRYYPRIRAIRNHIFFERQKLKKSLIDQEALLEKVDEWKRENPTNSIYFRPKCSSSTGDKTDENSECETNVKRKSKSSQNSLLFVYQEPWQKRLLLRYGNELVLLDATYRTTRYALPLFFLVVKTNIDYQVAGAFVSENESEESITEALQILKQWNPQFKPKYFMTDYSTEEIGAVKTVFSKSHLLLISLI